MLAAEKADKELQDARMRELFGDFQQETTELIVDMEPEAIEPVKHVTIEEDEAIKEKTKLREQRQNSKEKKDGSDRGTGCLLNNYLAIIILLIKWIYSILHFMLF